MVGEALDRKQPGQVLRQQAKRLRLLKVAQRIHLPLGVARMRGKLRASSSRHASQSGSASSTRASSSSSSSIGCRVR